jgi:putative sterol carrier protein
VEWILRRIFKQISRGQNTSLRVVFADDGTYSNREGEPDITIKFHTRAAEWQSLLLGYVGLFEAYFDGEVDITGDRPVARLMRMGFSHLPLPRQSDCDRNAQISRVARR